MECNSNKIDLAVCFINESSKTSVPRIPFYKGYKSGKFAFKIMTTKQFLLFFETHTKKFKTAIPFECGCVINLIYWERCKYLDMGECMFCLRQTRRAQADINFVKANKSIL